MQAYARAAVYSVVAMGDRLQGRPLAARWGGVCGVGVTTDA